MEAPFDGLLINVIMMRFSISDKRYRAIQGSVPLELTYTLNE